MEEKNCLNLKGDMISSTIQITLVGVLGRDFRSFGVEIFLRKTDGGCSVGSAPKKSDDAHLGDSLTSLFPPDFFLWPKFAATFFKGKRIHYKKCTLIC